MKGKKYAYVMEFWELLAKDKYIPFFFSHLAFSIYGLLGCYGWVLCSIILEGGKALA